jgi:hypothetical protein
MSALDWLMQRLGDERQDTSTPGEKVVRQDASGNFVPYKPPSGADALQMLYEMTGVPGMQSAQAAWNRGEYLPAIGQEAASVGQLASSVLPVARGLGAAGKFAAPVAREMAASVPDLLADEAGALKLPGGGPIRAYHGSPHDFDRFDSSKIGTGEGVQAYGHGLYFAEEPSVAQSYRDQSGVSYWANDKKLGTVGELRNDPVALAAHFLYEGKGAEGAREQLRSSVESHMAGNYGIAPSLADRVEQSINDLASQKIETRPSGKMYEVDLHVDPARLLDRDKPLSEQPHVKAALDALSVTAGPRWELLPKTAMATAPDRLTPQAAAAALREVGIPGVKYLDQGSRDAGGGTSNYVMFDDKLIEILRKYGLAGLTAGTGAAVLGGSAEAAPADALDRIRRQLGEGAF